jgi:hypothetical protein
MGLRHGVCSDVLELEEKFMKVGSLVATSLVAATTSFLFPSVAFADENIARDVDNHPHHAFELEPHFLLAPLFDHGAPGVGVRGTVTLLDRGFIDSVNDTVGLGFGADWTEDTTWVPIVLQWNFFLSENWSVFAEPGAALRLRDDFRDRGPDFTVYGGARFHFSRNVTLTMRVGHPAFALGLSFLI